MDVISLQTLDSRNVDQELLLEENISYHCSIECHEENGTSERVCPMYCPFPNLDGSEHLSDPFVPDGPPMRLEHTKLGDCGEQEMFDNVVEESHTENIDVEWRKRGARPTKSDSGYSSSSRENEGLVTIELRKSGDSEISRMGKVSAGTTYLQIWLSLRRQAANMIGHEEFDILKQNKLLFAMLQQSVHTNQSLEVRPRY